MNERDMAYEAGRRAALSEPARRRHEGACPFAPRTDETEAWLTGFREVEADPEAAAEEMEGDRAEEMGLVKRWINDDLPVEDDAG